MGSTVATLAHRGRNGRHQLASQRAAQAGDPALRRGYIHGRLCEPARNRSVAHARARRHSRDVAWASKRTGASETSPTLCAQAESTRSRSREETRTRAESERQRCFIATDAEHRGPAKEAQALSTCAPALLPRRIVAGLWSCGFTGSRDQCRPAGESRLCPAPHVSTWTTRHQHRAAAIRSGDMGRVRVCCNCERQSLAANSEAERWFIGRRRGSVAALRNELRGR